MLEDLEAVTNGFVSIDVEGDGNNPSSPVEICVVEHRDGRPAGTCRWLVNPGVPMSAFVQGFHGITDAMVADAPRFSEIEQDVRSAIEGRVVVAHAAADDLRMLRTVIPDVDFLPEAVIDVQRLARSLVPGRKRYGLEAVCSELGLRPAEGEGRHGYHTAATDSAMAGSAFLALVRMIPDSKKQKRHFAQMAQVVMSPSVRAARLEELASIGIVPGLREGARP